VIAGIYCEFNRHGPPTVDWVFADHRRATPFASNDLSEIFRAARELTPDLRVYTEAVHRLSALGAVITSSSRGTSTEGFDAEWRMVQILTVDCDRITSCELFDEADLDAALTRFAELHTPVPR
jgi:hypothetical protein